MSELKDRVAAAAQAAHDEALKRIMDLVGSENPVTDVEAVLKDAALLNEMEYDMLRKPLALRLKLSRATVLDKEVKKRRSEREEGAEEPLDFGIVETELWPDPVDGAELFAKIAATLKRFIVFQREEDVTQCVLWVAGTHCYDEFDIYPRLNITAVGPGCGKTTLERLLQDYCSRALACDNLSASFIFRAIEAAKPLTLVIDELDSFIEKDKEVVNMLNSGHKKGGWVGRVEKEGERHRPRRFETFCPVIYGMIGRPPGPLATRSLVVRLLKKKPGQATEDYDKTEHQALEAEMTELRRQIARWVHDRRPEIRAAKPDTKTLSNRDRDNWRPLLKIASVVGGSWLDKVYLAAGVEIASGEESIQIQLLRDIRNILHSRKVKQIPSDTLVRDLLCQAESPWGTYRNGRDPLDQCDLAKLLRRDLGVTSKGLALSKEEQMAFFATARDKKVVRRGYCLDQFAQLIEHQLAGEQPEEVEVSAARADAI